MMSDVLKKAMGDLPLEPHVDDALLAAYLDGALEESQRQHVELHAAHCSQCAQDLAAAASVEIEADAVARVDRPRRKPEAAGAPALRSKTSRSTSGRMWMRLAAGIVLVAGASWLTVQASRFGADRLEPVLLAQLEEWTERRVSSDTLSLTLAGGPGIEIAGLAIDDDPAFSESSFLHTRRVTLNVHPSALLGGRLEGSVDVDGPVVRLVRSPGGNWNVETLGGATPSGAARRGIVSAEIEQALDDAANAISPTGVDPNPRVQLTSASIHDGTLEIADLGRGGAALRVKNVDISYHGTPGQRASVSLEGRVGSADDRIALRGEIGPFEGNVVPVYRLREVELEAVPVSEIPGSPRAVDGQLTFDGHLESAGRALVDIVAAARGAGEMQLCCGAFEGRNLARDFVSELTDLPGGERVRAAVRANAALASALQATGTTYDHLGGVADLRPGTLHLAGLELDTPLFRADADASIGLEGHLAAEGDLRVSADLGHVILAAAPALASLAASDGTVELPFRASGSWENLRIELDVQRLLARIEKSQPAPWLDWLASLLEPQSARFS